MKKEEQASLVHELGLGKRQRHAHKTGQQLSQGVIPPVLATWDIRSNTCTLTMSFTHIFSALST